MAARTLGYHCRQVQIQSRLQQARPRTTYLSRRPAAHCRRQICTHLSALHAHAAQVAGQEAGQDLQDPPSPDSYKPEEVAAAPNAGNKEEEEVRQDAKGGDGPQEAWAKEELAALNADEAVSAPNSVNYALNVLWLERNIGMAVDQVFGESETQRRAPVTEYFFWPRNDAWDEAKAAMETKPYISERQRIDLLNKVTQVIRLWENDEQGRLPIDEARAAMPEISFVGS